MVHNHIKNSQGKTRCQVVTVSDTRTEENDKSGRLMIDMLEKNGHVVQVYEIVKDEYALISSAIQEGIQSDEIEVVLLNGGTGIAKRDVTIEVVKPFLEKEMVGFGELFRFLSYTEDIGPAAILSRAIAGVAHNKVIFSVPGSTGAVRLAMDKLIVPELGHLIWELNKDKK